MRVGVIGAGGMGNVHANQYKKMPDVELFAFDTDRARLKAYVEKWGAKGASSAADLISKADAVDVCVPTDLHLDYGLKAIAAGRAVFMEKPLASSLEDGSKLIEAAAKANVPLMPGQVVRFFPEFRRANETVKSGQICRRARSLRAGVVRAGARPGCAKNNPEGIRRTAGGSDSWRPGWFPCGSRRDFDPPALAGTAPSLFSAARNCKKPH